MTADFGDCGVCGVRWDKAAKGGPPRRSGVLTVFGWSTEVLAEWIEDGQPPLHLAVNLFIGHPISIGSEDSECQGTPSVLHGVGGGTLTISPPPIWECEVAA